MSLSIEVTYVLLSFVGPGLIGVIKLIPQVTSKYLMYYYHKKRYYNKIKKAILERQFESLNKYVSKLKAFDLKHETSKHKKIYKLYNLTDEIVNNKREFNIFYNLSSINLELIEEYAKEHSLTIVHNNTITPEPSINNN